MKSRNTVRVLKRLCFFRFFHPVYTSVALDGKAAYAVRTAFSSIALEGKVIMLLRYVQLKLTDIIKPTTTLSNPQQYAVRIYPLSDAQL